MGGPHAPSCAACGAPSHSAHRPSSEVLAELRSLPECDRVNVSLRGGPLTHAEVVDTVAAAAASGVSRIRLEDDAAAMDLVLARSLVAAGVRHFRPTLLASDETHDAMCGRQGAFAAAMKGIDAFLEAAGEASVEVLVSVRVPVCAHNLHEAASAVAAAASAGAGGVLIDVARAVASHPDAGAWIAAACDTGSTSAVWAGVAGMPAGSLPHGYAPHVVYSGEETG